MRANIPLSEKDIALKSDVAGVSLNMTGCSSAELLVTDVEFDAYGKNDR